MNNMFHFISNRYTMVVGIPLACVCGYTYIKYESSVSKITDVTTIPVQKYKTPTAATMAVRHTSLPLCPLSSSVVGHPGPTTKT